MLTLHCLCFNQYSGYYPVPKHELWCKHGDSWVSIKYIIPGKGQTFWIIPQSGWHISIGWVWLWSIFCYIYGPKKKKKSFPQLRLATSWSMNSSQVRVLNFPPSPVQWELTDAPILSDVNQNLGSRLYFVIPQRMRSQVRRLLEAHSPFNDLA